MSIYFTIYIIVTILLIIITNNVVYLDHIKNKYNFNKSDDYIAANIYPLVWPGVVIAIIIIFGLQLIWKYILFKLLTLPARLYLRYKKK